jgi:general stress protein YciG
VAENRRTSNRGFASMDRETQRRIASKGGRSVPSEKRSFSMNRKLAAEAGRKGGQASHGGAPDDHEETASGSTEARQTPPSESTGHTEQ